jgi:potassium efflux system protein
MLRALSILSLSISVAFAQDTLLDVLDGDDVTAEQVEAAIAAVESQQGLDDNERAVVLEQLLEGQVQIQSRLNTIASARKFAAALETAPAETARLRSNLDEETVSPAGLDNLGISEETTLAELEQMLAQESVEYSGISTRLSELRDLVDAEIARPDEVRDRIGQLRASRDELEAQISAPDIPGEQALVAQARLFSVRMTQAAHSAEIGKLEQELLSHSVRLSLLQAQRDVAARSELELAPRVELLREAVNEKTEAAAVRAQREADEAEAAFADQHPVLRSLAEENAELMREIPKRVAATRQLSDKLQITKNELADIEQRLARSERRLEIGGLSRVLGSIMIAERRSLPSLPQYRAEIRSRNREAAVVGLDRIQAQEQRRELVSIDLAVQDLVADIAEDVTDAAELEAIGREVRQLLLVKRDLLLQIENSYGSYLQVLGNLDLEQRNLLNVTEEYQQFLAKNLLWIPSAPFFGSSVVQGDLPAYPYSLTSEAWSSVGVLLTASVGEHVVVSVFCLALLVLLLLLRKPLARQYTVMAARVGRLSTDNIGLTIASLAIVAVRVLPIPFLLFSVSWFLFNASQPTVFSETVARSLLLTTPFFYNLLFFGALSKPDGILSLHFGWKDRTLEIMRRQLHRLAIIAAPLVFATAILFLSESQSDRAVLGRIVFIALVIFLSSVIRPILHPKTGLVAAFYEKNAASWIAKLRWTWFGLGVGSPLVLGVISLFGFLYTSTILVGLLVNTFWRVLGLVIIYLVILRWLALARRKLALQIALQEREARRAEKSSEQDPDADGPPAVAEVPLDLDEVDQQTRKLLRSIMIVLALVVGWQIWADVLPAFSFLNDVALWTQTATVDGIDKVVPVTAADVLLALLVIVVTVIGSRNIPGLMHILILQRLTLAPGSRYAINTLVRYVIVTIGTISVLNLIGWNWSQIQWLVAALSVGLGFGLQEIVANFVAGLIILFERPVRVGDTVTVGQLTGTVSRVRIRATTITDWDRKEILVPNKAFITEQVVNWTLSDPITRVVLQVGVAYGSDAEQVNKVMEDTLVSLPLVLDEPPPKVYFTGFGDSSLNFTIHAYLRELSDRMPMVHAIHDAILKALRENDIEIPFPQRDIHVRSTVEKNGE